MLLLSLVQYVKRVTGLYRMLHDLIATTTTTTTTTITTTTTTITTTTITTDGRTLRV
jgi:hypothetical protein